eukprot:TRINITY_DN25926_c0_g1_i1.p1 TRINITY_DN25926_c0_g1~~TRINITY_DN25926_c0_g1_i1.p1  ORF type:complete len:353 (+),score=72.81 TRINITY_DN25926_c0_g1_i1:457-1515(+)
MKYAVATFIELNEDICLGGTSIDVIVNDGVIKSAQKFVKIVVEPMGESARTLIPIVTPLVLRCNINSIYLDPADKKFEFSDMNCVSTTKGFDFRWADPLNFHDKTLYLLLKPGHYDLLLQSPSDYDKEFQDLMTAGEENKEELDDIESENMCVTPCCNREYRTNELVEELIKLKNNYKRKEGKVRIIPSCCGKKVDLEIFKSSLTSDQYEVVIKEFQSDLDAKDKVMIAMPCCKAQTKGTELVFIHKKLKLDPNKIKCPECNRELDIDNLSLSKKIHNMIQDKDFCNLCDEQLGRKTPAAACKCGRKYHKSCLKRYDAVSYTHLRAHETSLHLVCRLLLEKKKKRQNKKQNK